MASTNVLYVKPQDAKKAKTLLEKQHFLDKRFRMTSKSIDAKHNHASSLPLPQKLIALPIVETCLEWFQHNHHHQQHADEEKPDWISLVQSCGVQICPFSTSVLGNHQDTDTSKSTNAEFSFLSLSSKGITTTQRILFQTILECQERAHIGSCDEKVNTTKNAAGFETNLLSSIQGLSNKTCPKKLEQLGEDTLVIPSQAFLMSDSSFKCFLENFTHDSLYGNKSNKDDFMTLLWQNLAKSHNHCQRIVRRGEIDPNSKIRHSGHIILWLSPSFLSSHNSSSPDTNNQSSSFTFSPGWITITEQQIRQSFDLTKLMFSRGNISEKIRFGSKLVKSNDIILDMYAGIGYYTLPAFIKGKAKFIYACEWNSHAIQALKYNLQQNGVNSNQYQLLHGDCRVTLKRMQREKVGIFQDDEGNENDRCGGVDRISLGLLPSSEGGWEIAIQCLNKRNGGWLHIHGNVAVSEKRNWSIWVCRRLHQYVQNYHPQSQQTHKKEKCWHVICHHVERVKSFAPKVDHLVADIFVGPLSSLSWNIVATDMPIVTQLIIEMDINNEGVGILTSGKQFIPCPKNVDPPSCALSGTGILHQEWMMMTEEEHEKSEILGQE